MMETDLARPLIPQIFALADLAPRVRFRSGNFRPHPNVGAPWHGLRHHHSTPASVNLVSVSSSRLIRRDRAFRDFSRAKINRTYGGGWRWRSPLSGDSSPHPRDNGSAGHL